MRKKINFIKLFQVWGIICLIGLPVSLVAIDVVTTYRDFNSRTDQLRSDYISSQKQMIKQEVDRVVEMIRYKKTQCEILTKKKIKSRVYEAYAVAQNIYQQNKTFKSNAEIQQMIIDALRPIRFENKSGYYFITRLDGVEVLFADKPQLEGLNLLNMQDARGQYVIKDMIEIVNQSGEGFYEYLWTKPEATEDDFKKISFIKRFEPYNWFIGTGLYVYDIESQVKEDLLSDISRIRFDKEGYIFVNRLNGDALVSNGKLFSGTKKLWEIFDDNPEKIKNIFEKENQAALTSAGDYIYYSWINLTTSGKELPKISFIYGFPEWQWLVGAGVYLDEVETNIALMQTELNRQIKTKMIYSFLMIIGITGLFFLFFTRLNRRLKNDFSLFISLFNRVANSDKKINRDKIKFVELDQMAEYANKMLTDRKVAKASAKSFLESVINTIADPVFVKDDKRRFVLVNEALCAIVGRTKVNLLGKDGDDMFPREEVAVFRKMDAIVLDTGRENVNEESLSNLSTGEARTIVTRKTRYIDPSGNRFLVGVIRDITERKLVEIALQESEERYKLLADNVIDNIWILQLSDLRMMYTSPSVERLLGYTPAEIQEMALSDYLTPESLEHVSIAISDELGKESNNNEDPNRSVIFQIEQIRKDGSKIWTEITASFLRDENGHADRILGITRDLTERKREERRVEKLNRLKENLLVSKSLGAKMKLITDALVDILHADFSRIWIMKQGDMCDSGCMHARVTEGPHICYDRNKCLHLVASSGRYTHSNGTHGRVPFGCYKIGRVASAEEPGFLTNDVIHDPGVHNHDWAREMGLMSFAGYRLVSEEGIPIGVIALFSKQSLSPEDEATLQTIAGTASDMILMSKSMDALQRSEERLRAVFAAAKEVSFIITDVHDSDPTIIEFSPGAENIFGYSRSEMLGHPVSILYAAEEIVKFSEVHQQMREGKAGFSGEVTLIRKSGENFPALFSTYPLFDEKGNMYASVGVSIDISERKQLENQLTLAHKMEAIGTLAGGIAHDFNNILSSILGFTELSIDDVEKGTHIEDNLQEVYTAGKRAKDLVKQILAFARQSDEEIKPVQVDQIAREVIKFIRSSIPTTIEIKQNIDSDSLIMGNATQVHQILMNLLTNAAHAMEDKGGILEISLKDVVIDRGENWDKHDLTLGNYIEIKVSDTGAGIAPEIIGSVFEPYFTTKGPGEGTGMGLAMVHGIVESYGGKITVDSKSGQGAVFLIYLPVTRKRQGRPSYQSEILPVGTERILFVDDEMPIARMGSQILERLGYSVTTRTSSVEALELFRAKSDDFDLVITDMTMPNMTGEKLSIEVMQIRPDIPVIICTGYSKSISEETAAEIGIKAFLYKPVVKAELSKSVRQVLDDNNE